jgi:hypothetical protein
MRVDYTQSVRSTSCASTYQGCYSTNIELRHKVLTRESFILLSLEAIKICYNNAIIIRMIKSSRMRWAGHVARMEKRNAYRILMGKPEGKRPLGRRRRRWVDNIKMDLREIGWDGLDWIDMAEYRDQWRALVNTVLNLRVP